MAGLQIDHRAIGSVDMRQVAVMNRYRHDDQGIGARAQFLGAPALR
jgi:hypothetical protein